MKEEKVYLIVKVDCEDTHTFRLLRDYIAESLGFMFTSVNNKIFVYVYDMKEAELVWDKVAYQLDMWSDLKAEIEIIE